MRFRAKQYNIPMQLSVFFDVLSQLILVRCHETVERIVRSISQRDVDFGHDAAGPLADSRSASSSVARTTQMRFVVVAAAVAVVLLIVVVVVETVESTVSADAACISDSVVVRYSEHITMT